MAHVLRQELVVGGKKIDFLRRELPLQVCGDGGPACLPAQFSDLVEAVVVWGWEGGEREGGGEG